MSQRRIYHPFHLWEDWKAGMWRKISVKESVQLLPMAVELMGNAELYGQWMLRVIVEWPATCEHNLTDLSQNRRAWVGHAGVTLATGIPESVTRSAWALLTREQRDAANAVADVAIETWECRANQVAP